MWCLSCCKVCDVCIFNEQEDKIYETEKFKEESTFQRLCFIWA